MGAVAFYPQSLLSFSKQLKLGRPVFSARGRTYDLKFWIPIIGFFVQVGMFQVDLVYDMVPFITLFNLAEIADCTSPFGFQKNPHKLTIVSIRSHENRRDRPPQKGSAAGRKKKGDGNKRPQLSDGQASSSSNQEEIIALFKQIQSSVSKGESVSMKKRDRIPSDGKRTVESVIDVLLHTQKEVKDTSSVKDGEVKEQETLNNEPVTNFKLARLPSTFVKRSPIPSASTPRGKVLEPNSKASANMAESEQLKLPRVEELKLPQLKELAKARGFKGYSRLKKSELIKLLRS
ncbi:hypothetical protein Patl1_10474 [Pistacia atlantica]|uniref:Uncharacterized protein n=1 Tax=Pistacia atlantica TaxID=434234 RepID=A0ACC1A333_9ROSI|nr:hypothetical protein Patl1_10474 [Pistacia atlantica]